MRASHYLPLALRLLKSAAGLGAICWTVGVLLTYAGAHSFAAAAGYGQVRAWLFPVTLDAVALVAYLALLMLPAGERWYPLLVVVLTAGASAAAQGYHQTQLGPGGVTDALSGPELPALVKGAAGAWPAVAALLAGHLVWMILARAIPTGLVVALRNLAAVDELAVAAAEAAVSGPVSRVPSARGWTREAAELEDAAVDTSRPAEHDASGLQARRVDPRPGDTSSDVEHDPSRGSARDASPRARGDASHAGEALHVVPPPVEPEPRAVGESVPVPAEVLDAVRAGTITQAEAARRAGVSVKTIRRRLDAAWSVSIA